MQDIINQYDMDGNGNVKYTKLFYINSGRMFKIEWLEFANVLASKLDLEDENYYKETFRVFSKNDEGKLRFLD